MNTPVAILAQTFMMSSAPNCTIWSSASMPVGQNSDRRDRSRSRDSGDLPTNIGRPVCLWPGAPVLDPHAPVRPLLLDLLIADDGPPAEGSVRDIDIVGGPPAEGPVRGRIVGPPAASLGGLPAGGRPHFGDPVRYIVGGLPAGGPVRDIVGGRVGPPVGLRPNEPRCRQNMAAPDQCHFRCPQPCRWCYGASTCYLKHGHIVFGHEGVRHMCRSALAEQFNDLNGLDKPIPSYLTNAICQERLWM